MGENVAQLSYGIKISRKEYQALNDYDWKEPTKPWKFQEFNGTVSTKSESGEALRGTLEYRNCPIELDNPYETEDYFIFIKVSQSSAWNGAEGLGKSIVSQPEWDDILKAAIVKYELEYSEPQWYLIGHYN